MSKYDIIVGIDPDVSKSGVCFIEVSTKKVEASAMTFPKLLDYLMFVKNRVGNPSLKKTANYADLNVLIVVEAGYLNKSNWHIKNSGSAKAAAIGNHSGRNHETARKIVEMARHYGFEVLEVRPLNKIWRGRDGKITQKELDNLMIKSGFGKLNARINQDVRDAVLISLWYSGVKIKL